MILKDIIPLLVKGKFFLNLLNIIVSNLGGSQVNLYIISFISIHQMTNNLENIYFIQKILYLINRDEGRIFW